MKMKSSGIWKGFDLTDESQLMQHFNAKIDETFVNYCKVYPSITGLKSCLPCITFRNSEVNYDVETIGVSR